jgi:hypothetical protein
MSGTALAKHRVRLVIDGHPDAAVNATLRYVNGAGHAVNKIVRTNSSGKATEAVTSGPVQLENLVGAVVARVWPWGRITVGVR